MRIPGEESTSGEVLPKLTRVVWHVTQFFWPPMGGQEYLITQMCKAAAEHGSRSVVLQPLTLRLLMPTTYSRRSWPPRTLILPVPTLAPFVALFKRLSVILPSRLRLTSQWTSDFGWRAFNWSLRVFHPVLWLWSRNGTVIVHYHLHQPYFSNSRTIVFSHGVEWRRPPITALDRLRAGSLGRVVRDSKVTLILANDRDYIDEAMGAAGVSSAMQKLHMLANPVDTVRFRPGGATASQQYSHRRLVMIRNVRRDRGILEGIQAFMSFRAQGRHSDWQLDIYGAFSSSDEYFRQCAAASASAGSAVRFHGNVPNDLVPQILARSSIALVPSQALEGTSLAALEAMASGVPCVSTPIGGLRDIPTYKSRSVEPSAIAEALEHVSANYERVRNEQILQTRQRFSLEAWKVSFCAAIAKVECEHA
jgi:glycosyltransferase involved in cell wall biosynthesis